LEGKPKFSLQNVFLPSFWRKKVFPLKKAGLEEAPVLGEVVQGASVVPKALKFKKVKNRKAGREPVADKALIIKPTQSEQAGID